METAFSGDVMTTHPLVSVCMITYNHAPYIGQAIEGVLMQQTDFPFELVIGEDCSTDRTRALCLDYQRRNPDKIRLLLHEGNLGIFENFHTTLHAGRGRYIAFCEGDDYWSDPLKLQKQVDFLESHPDYGCVYTDFDIFYQHTGVLVHSLFRTNRHYRLHGDLSSFICTPQYCAPCSWLFRRDLLGELPVSVDGTFVLFAHLLSQAKIYFLPEATAVYRCLPESASHTASAHKLYARESALHATQLELAEKYGLSPTEKDRIDYNYYGRFFRLMAALGLGDEVAKARKILKNGSLKFRVRLLLSHMEWVRRRWRRRYGVGD